MKKFPKLTAALALFLLIVAAHAPAIRGQFIWDDDQHLTANPHIVGPLGLREIWTSGEANYFPLVLTHFWILHRAWQLEPLPYHVVNLILHALAALALWRTLERLRIPGAWFAAAVWALHPIQVESVAWISEMKNTQSAVFYFLSVLFFLRWREESPTEKLRPGLFYAASLLCALLAFLSKSSTVMLPVVLVLCGWWRPGSWRIGNLISLAPFFLAAAAVAGWTIWEQKFRSGALGAAWAQSPAERAILAGQSVWFYLGKLVWPSPLAFIYPRWEIDALNPARYLPLLALIAGVLWLARRTSPVGRGAFFAIAYFLALLLPVSGWFSIYFFRYSFVADHFQYLASVGPLAGIVALASSLALPTAPRGLRLAIGGALLAGLAMLTWRQSSDYRDDETLGRRTLARNPDAWLMHNNLGAVLGKKGDADGAAACYETALRLNPNFEEAHTNLAALLAARGRGEEAIGHYRAALRAAPDYAEAHSNLAVELDKFPGRRAEALAHFQHALRLQEENPELHFNFAVALAREPEQRVAAITHYRRAFELRPGFAAAHSNLADLLAAEPGRSDEAIAHYETALRLNPDYSEAHNNLANALARIPGREQESLAHYERALQLRPDYAEAHNNFATALARLPGKVTEALAHYERALALQPDFAVAHHNLASALARIPGRERDAISHYEAAIRIDPGLVASRRQLAALYAQLGDPRRARAQLEAALAVRPADPAILQQLEQLPPPGRN